MIARLRRHLAAAIIFALVLSCFGLSILSQSSAAQRARVAIGSAIICAGIFTVYVVFLRLSARWRGRRQTSAAAAPTPAFPQPRPVEDHDRRAGFVPAAAEVTSLVYAGFWRRVFASALDWMLCLGAAWTASALLYIHNGPTYAGPYGSLSPVLSAEIIGTPLLIILYFTICWTKGRTLGMRAAGIRIVDQRTLNRPRAVWMLPRAIFTMFSVGMMLALPISVAVAILIISLEVASNPRISDATANRWLAISVVPFLILALLGVYGHLRMLRSARRQTWFDKIGGTIVVRSR